MSETALLKQPAASRSAEPVALRAVPAPVPLVVGTPQPLGTQAPALAPIPASRPAAYRQAVQRQQAAASPVFQAATLRQGVNLEHRQQTGQLQRQIAGLQAALPEGAEQDALRRQQEQASTPAVPGFYASKPPAGSTPGFSDVTGLYRYEASEVQKTDNGRGVLSEPLRAIQRRAVGQFAAAYRTSQTPVLQRARELGQTLACVQRMPFGSEVASVVTSRPGGLPTSDLPLIQRAMNEADAALVRQEQQDAQVHQLHALQRQLADHEGQQEQARVLQRVRERAGAGDPLPEAVQRHLEQGLNTDLSRVRVHTDGEADQMARGVGARAFTSGADIYFKAGEFQPNTRSGLELLAHEVTHTHQQARGQVGRGIDPDAGLETQAQQMGTKLASTAPDLGKPVPQPKQVPRWTPPQFQPSPYAPGVYRPQAALQRAREGAVASAYLHPFLSLQRQSDGTIQRDWLGDAWNATGGKVVNAVGDLANKGVEWAKGQLAGLLGNIPGYRPLCLTFGKDLVTGKAMDQNPSAILDALAGFVPGPLKDMIARLRETNAIPKAWEWFKGELGKLDLGGVLGDVAGAIAKLPPDLDKAKNAVTSRISRLEQLVVGSVRKIAEIALDAVAAGLGPAAQRVVAALKRSGDTIVQVLQNPGSFAKHLIDAVGQGFKQFASNAPRHLAQGVGQWLTGTSGISFPDKLDFQGVFMTVLSVLGLTYQNFRAKLVRSVGAEKMAKAEKTVDVVQNLASRGLHAAEEMKGSQAEVGHQVKTEVIGEIRNSVIIAAVQKIVTMFVPGGGFINALISAFDTVSFLIDKARDLVALGMSVINSVGQIAAGNVAAAAGGVERSIALSIPVALNFLSKLLHLGNIGGKVKGIISKLKAKLDGLVDRVMKRVSSLIDKVLGKLPGGKKDASTKDSKNQNATSPNQGGKTHTPYSGKLGDTVNFTAGGEAHRVWAEAHNDEPQLMIASTPREARDQLNALEQEARQKSLLGTVQGDLQSARSAVNKATTNLRRALRRQGADTSLAEAQQLAKSESGRVANIVTTIFNKLHVGGNYQVVTDGQGVQRMQRVSVAFHCPKTFSRAEFQSQTLGQQAGLNALRVSGWAANRARYLALGRAPEGGRAQQSFRAQQRLNIIAQKTAEYVQKGKSLDEAERLAIAYANRELGRTAALHNPDQNAGGEADQISSLGDRRINSSLGSQWKDAVTVLDSAVARIPSALVPQLRMNVGIRTSFD